MLFNWGIVSQRIFHPPYGEVSLQKAMNNISTVHILSPSDILHHKAHSVYNGPQCWGCTSISPATAYGWIKCLASTTDCKLSYSLNYLLSNDTSSVNREANGNQLKFHISSLEYNGLESISHWLQDEMKSPFSYGNSTQCHQTKKCPIFFCNQVRSNTTAP